jgi:hypothetical protein
MKDLEESVNAGSSLSEDDEFDNFAMRHKKERDEAKFNISGGGQFEDIKWVSLEQNQAKILRIVSGPPNTSKNTAGRELFISEVKDDDGKFFRLKLPLREDRLEKDHLMWRLISKFLETEWVDKKRVSKWASIYPDLVERISHGGEKEGTLLYKYSKGFVGQRRVIFNVIDREDMDWHRKYKHTKLLSKFINKKANDKGEEVEYPVIGVPSYGFIDELVNLISESGSWVNYDIAITKTGIKNTPYRMDNASAIAKAVRAGVPEMGKKSGLSSRIELISTNPLTDEEKSWAFYDLKKFYSPTSYTALVKHFKDLLKQGDAAFKEDFYDECVEKAKEEADAREAAKKEREETEKVNGKTAVSGVAFEPDYDEDISHEPFEPPEEKDLVEKTNLIPQYTSPTLPPCIDIPTRSVKKPETSTSVEQAARTKLTPEKLTLLRGWNDLTNDQQNLIEDVIIENGKVKKLIFTDGDLKLLACSECGIPSPAAFDTVCAVCGAKFE